MEPVRTSPSMEIPPRSPSQSTLTWILSLPNKGLEEVYRIFVGGGEIWREKNFALALESMKGIEGADWLETTQNLREQLKETPSSPDLLQISKNRISGNDHFSFHDSILRSLIGEHFEDVKLENQFKKIEDAPYQVKEKRISVLTGCAMGASGYLFDPHLYNIPSVLYHLNDKVNIRMASPTRKGLTGPTEPIPEMVAYINGLERPHVYINLQSLNEGSEKSRSRAIQKLGNENFKFISLDHDAPFFYQKESPEEQSPDEFKTAFLEFLRSDHCSLFEGLNEEAQIQTAQEILYPKKEALTKPERKNIIFLTYALITLKAIHTTNCQSFNISCKDGIDRAAILNTLLFQHLLIFTSRENEPKMKRALFTTLHVPAFLVKSQAVLKHRRERLLLIWDLIQTTEVKKRLRAFGNCYIHNLNIPEHPHQAVLF